MNIWNRFFGNLPADAAVQRGTSVPEHIEPTRPAKQLLELLDTYNASSAEKEAARKELLSMGGMAVDPILDFLESKHKLFGEVELLTHIGPPAVEPILARLQTCEWYTFMRATEALGKIRDPRAVPFLITQLQGTGWRNAKQREFSANALGEIGDASAVPALIAVLEVGDDGNDSTGLAAAKALGKIADPTAIEPLMKIFRPIKFSYCPRGQATPEEMERGRQRIVAAAWSLAVLGVREVEDALQTLIAHAGDPYWLPQVNDEQADELRNALKRLRSPMGKLSRVMRRSAV